MIKKIYVSLVMGFLLFTAFCGSAKNTYDESQLNEDNFAASLKGAEMKEPEPNIKMRSGATPEESLPVTEPAAVNFQASSAGEAYFYIIIKNDDGQFPVAARTIVRDETGKFLSDTREETSAGLYLHNQVWYNTPEDRASGGKVFCVNTNGNIIDCPQNTRPTEVVWFDRPSAGKLELRKPISEQKILYYEPIQEKNNRVYRKVIKNITHEYTGVTLYENKDTAIVEQKISAELFSFTTTATADKTFIDKNLSAAKKTNVTLSRKGYINVTTGNIVYMTQKSDAASEAPSDLKDLQQKFIWPPDNNR